MLLDLLMSYLISIAVFGFVLAGIFLEISSIFCEKCSFLAKLDLLTPDDLDFELTEKRPKCICRAGLGLSTAFYRFSLRSGDRRGGGLVTMRGS